MRVAGDHLVGDTAHDIVEAERARLLGHRAVIDHLQQQVAQLAAQILHRAALDRVGDLVGFLDRVGRDGLEALFDIPGAARFGIAQAAHDFQKARHAACGVVNQGVFHNPCHRPDARNEKGPAGGRAFPCLQVSRDQNRNAARSETELWFMSIS